MGETERSWKRAQSQEVYTWDMKSWVWSPTLPGSEHHQLKFWHSSHLLWTLNFPDQLVQYHQVYPPESLSSLWEPTLQHRTKWERQFALSSGDSGRLSPAQDQGRGAHKHSHLAVSRQQEALISYISYWHLSMAMTMMRMMWRWSQVIDGIRQCVESFALVHPWTALLSDMVYLGLQKLSHNLGTEKQSLRDLPSATLLPLILVSERSFTTYKGI